MMGPAECQARLPLVAASSGSKWIVRGRTSPDGLSNTFLRGFHIYIDKTTAEIRGLATMDMKTDISPDTLRILRKEGRRPSRARILGLPPGPSRAGMPADLVMVVYNGVLGTPDAAIAYARVLMRASPRLAALADSELRAGASDDIWHVTRSAPDGKGREEVLSLSQVNGKVLSRIP